MASTGKQHAEARSIGRTIWLGRDVFTTIEAAGVTLVPVYESTRLVLSVAQP